MKKFYFRIYQAGDEDGSNIFQIARTKQEAENIIRREYHSIDRLDFIKFE